MMVGTQTMQVHYLIIRCLTVFCLSYHRKEVCKTSGTLANNLAPQTTKSVSLASF